MSVFEFRREPSATDEPLPSVLTLAQWAERELPEPDFLMGSWLHTASRVLLYADTGLGKTIWAMALGMHASAGKRFLHWHAHRPCKVLYVDGEMSRRLYKRRLIDGMGRLGEAPEGFFALSREDVENLQPLNTRAGQAYIERIIDHVGGVDLIILDSIMCLLAGNMREPELWAQTLQWVQRLTKQSIAQLWINHTGHDTSHSYGDKSKEWVLDTVLSMEEVQRPGADISFNLHFQKARERTPETRDDFADAKICLLGGRWISDLNLVRKREPSPLAQKFFEALVNVLAGDEVKVIDGRRCATEDQWRVECQRLRLLDPKKPDSERSLLSKNRRALIELNWIACNNEWAAQLHQRNRFREEAAGLSRSRLKVRQA